MVEATDTIDVGLQKNYKADYATTIVILILMQIALLAALIFFTFYQVESAPRPVYFPAAANKQVIKPVPLDEPALNSAAILNWATEAVRVSFSFNYRSIQVHLAKVMPYFDQRGLDKFFSVIKADPNCSLVVADKLIVSIAVREAPKIVKEGKIENRYVWRVLLPMSIRYENATILRRADINIDMYIWRVPETESPIGIKITNLRVEIIQGYEPQAVLKKSGIL